jgi:methanogenic corrinoid protein MtbC1
VRACLDPALAKLPTMPNASPTCLVDGPLQDTAQQYLLAVLENRRDRAWEILEASARSGTSRDELVRHVLIATQTEVGRMWQHDELSIVEEHLASEVAETCLSRLYRLQDPRAPNGLRVLTTSVSGDQHRIGARWLALSFESNGWDVVALGGDLPGEELVHAVSEFECDVVCLGATLVSSVRAVARAVAAARNRLTARPVAVLVGGQPFRVVDDLWRVVGADATAPDPIAAVEVAAGLMT